LGVHVFQRDGTGDRFVAGLFFEVGKDGFDADDGVGRGGIEIKIVADADSVAARAPAFVGEVELDETVELLGVVVEDDEAVFEDGAEVFHAGVVRDEAFASGFVGDGEQAVNLDGAFFFERHHFFAEAVGVGEVGEVDAEAWREAGQFGGGAGGLELAERVRGAVGVAPEPVNFFR
jgi:hypothetical protein